MGAHDRNDLQNKYLGLLWAEHFPKRYHNAASQTLCRTLSHIIRNKAQISLPFAEATDKLNHVLSRFGIPEDEFCELDKTVPVSKRRMLTTHARPIRR